MDPVLQDAKWHCNILGFIGVQQSSVDPEKLTQFWSCFSDSYGYIRYQSWKLFFINLAKSLVPWWHMKKVLSLCMSVQLFSPARILNCLDPDPFSLRIQFGSGSTTLVLRLCMWIPLPLQYSRRLQWAIFSPTSWWLQKGGEVAEFLHPPEDEELGIRGVS